MTVNLFLGNLLLIFGIMKIGMYLFGKNLKLSRLEALKARFGSRKGTWIYLFVYAALPIIFAVLILFREYRLLN